MEERRKKEKSRSKFKSLCETVLREWGSNRNVIAMVCYFQRVDIQTHWVTDIYMVYNHLPQVLQGSPYVYFVRTSTGRVPG